MKTVILLRHAKSSWKHPELKDIERPLKKRGLKDAPIMGKVLNDLQVKPELIISSPANRALSTAKIVAKELDISEENIQQEPNLYLESESKMLNEIRNIDDRYKTVMVVGHNPTMTNLANTLTKGSIDNIPTSGIVGIEFEVDSWRDVSEGKQSFFEFPKKHRDKD